MEYIFKNKVHIPKRHGSQCLWTQGISWGFFNFVSIYLSFWVIIKTWRQIDEQVCQTTNIPLHSQDLIQKITYIFTMLHCRNAYYVTLTNFFENEWFWMIQKTNEICFQCSYVTCGFFFKYWFSNEKLQNKSHWKVKLWKKCPNFSNPS